MAALDGKPIFKGPGEPYRAPIRAEVEIKNFETGETAGHYA
jgi:hypothetical protein